MEFSFNLNRIFKTDISKINHTLLPSDFVRNGRSEIYCEDQVAEVIDAMGHASGKSQNLQHPATSADKIRNGDHTVYIMIEPNDNDGKGSVIGLLEMGVKNLFLNDASGMTHEMKTLCVLDFYIHESKQRSGYGKQLYDFMLHDLNVAPCKLAVDKPSTNFLSFLYKHYGMAKIYPQTNNFVLFEGFFSDQTDVASSVELPSSNSDASDRIEKDTRNCYDNHSVKSQGYIPTLYGRHTAFKLHDTMGQMIGDDSVGDYSTSSSSKLPENNGQENTPTLHGRHTAVKLPDMEQMIGDDSTSSPKSPENNGV